VGHIGQDFPEEKEDALLPAAGVHIRVAKIGADIFTDDMTKGSGTRNFDSGIHDCD
jgi:hypothetical protein